MRKGTYYALFIFLFSLHCPAQSIITTISGGATTGSGGDGGPATAATFNQPIGIRFNSHQDLIIADQRNNKIRRINAITGIITTIAGTGVAGFTGDSGLAISATFNLPGPICIDPSDNIYICDYLNYRIRKIDATTGIITTIAGIGDSGYTGDGGAALSARLYGLAGICLDDTGNLYIVQNAPIGQVRKISAATGIISTLFSIFDPTEIATDHSGNLYICCNSTLAGYNLAAGTAFPIAGSPGMITSTGDGGPATDATLESWAICVDGSSNLFFTDLPGHKIRMVNAATHIVNTIAGSGTVGLLGDGGPATACQMLSGFSLCQDTAQNIYVIDENRIRKVTHPFDTLTPTDIPAIAGISVANVYPIPSSGIITINTESSSPVTITITSLGGKCVLQQATTQREKQLDLSALPDGLYLLTLYTYNQTKTTRIKIQH